MKSGTILLLGATNSGKSTLVNQIVGKRVSMVSRKKQSTTFNQKAVKNISETEFILQDTPGIYSAKTKISNKMTNTAFSAIDEANIILVVVDSGSTKNNEINKIIKTLNESNNTSKIFLVINKIDKVNRETVLEKIKDLGDSFKVLIILFISLFLVEPESTTTKTILASSIAEKAVLVILLLILVFAE